MFAKLLLLSALVVKGISASPVLYGSRFEVFEGRGCETRVSEETRWETEEVLGRYRSDLVARDGAPTTATVNPIVFDVYWHVIYTNETQSGGYITDNQIQRQMKVMNNDFRASKISWNFKNTTRIKNEEWFFSGHPGSEAEAEMKGQYHKGNAAVLNIFTAQFNATTRSLGFASLPAAYEKEPLLDGLTIRHSTVPGGSTKNYNEGRTVVHELGHWLGLYHTFENGCDAPGDHVDDTAPQASESVGCPIGRKSCPDSDLPDPVQNFMDYSFDSCMSSFTPGQTLRMHESAAAFRFNKTIALVPVQKKKPVVQTPLTFEPEDDDEAEDYAEWSED